MHGEISDEKSHVRKRNFVHEVLTYRILNAREAARIHKNISFSRHGDYTKYFKGNLHRKCNINVLPYFIYNVESGW